MKQVALFLDDPNPIHFDADAVRQNIAVQSAVVDRYRIAYEAAVLRALEEVENALTAYAEEQLRRERLLDAVDAAQKAVDLAQDQYAAGLVDFSNVLDAQRSLLSFQDALAVIRETVPFPFVLGCVCPHPCEAECRRGDPADRVATMAFP